MTEAPYASGTVLPGSLLAGGTPTRPDPLLASMLAAEVRRPEDPLRLRQGVVTAIDAGPPPSITLNLGGTDVPGCRYLQGYVPHVGDVVWCLRNGLDVIALGTLPQNDSAAMRLTQFAGDGTQTSTTSTTGAAMGAAGAQGIFTAPPSGIVEFTVGAQLRCATAGQSAVMGFEVKAGSTIGSGTVFLAHDINKGVLNANTQNIRTSMTFPVTGLTPFAVYNTRTVMFTTNAAATAFFAWTFLSIRPSP